MNPWREWWKLDDRKKRSWGDFKVTMGKEGMRAAPADSNSFNNNDYDDQDDDVSSDDYSRVTSKKLILVWHWIHSLMTESGYGDDDAEHGAGNCLLLLFFFFSQVATPLITSHWWWWMGRHEAKTEEERIARESRSSGSVKCRREWKENGMRFSSSEEEDEREREREGERVSFLSLNTSSSFHFS